MKIGKSPNNNQRKIYFAGNTADDNGPSLVNRNYYYHLKDRLHYVNSNNKIIRIIHLLINITRSDSVLVSGLSDFHLLAIKLSKLFRKKSSYLMHGYAKTEQKINSIYNSKQITLEKSILQYADQIICVSERFAEYLKTEEPELSNKITFVNNGIEKINIKKKLKFSKNTINITTIGGGIPRKNTLTICNAISLLNDSRIILNVIGPVDKEGDEIRKYPFVNFMNNLDHKFAMKVLEESDIYVQNSIFETFGLSVCEAVSRRCNILISKNVGALSVLEGIEANNLIEDSFNSNEIAQKITQLTFRNSKVKFKSETDWHSVSQILLQTISSR